MFAGLGAALAARQRRWFILASGLFAAPTGLGDVMFVPEYWHPVHLIGPHLSVEGVMFSFGNGCLIAALLLLGRSQMQVAYPRAIVDAVLRICLPMMIGFIIFLLAWKQGAGPLMIMHAAFLGFVVMLVFLWLRGGLSLNTTVVGGFGFFLVYALEIAIWHQLDPDFMGFWASDRSYLLLLPMPEGLPVEELIWAISYGAVWSNLLIYGFNRQSARSGLKSP